jgi:hypothetical protein
MPSQISTRNRQVLIGTGTLCPSAAFTVRLQGRVGIWMTWRPKARAYVCAGIIALTCLACSPVEPPASPNTDPRQTTGAAGATESPVPAAPSKQQTAAARRGNIAESVAANGRVGGVDEVPLSLTVASRVPSRTVMY